MLYIELNEGCCYLDVRHKDHKEHSFCPFLYSELKNTRGATGLVINKG